MDNGLLICTLAVVFIIGTKILNRVMVKVTHTNEEVIQAMEGGLLWDRLPDAPAVPPQAGEFCAVPADLS